MTCFSFESDFLEGMKQIIQPACDIFQPWKRPTTGRGTGRRERREQKEKTVFKFQVTLNLSKSVHFTQSVKTWTQ